MRTRLLSPTLALCLAIAMAGLSAGFAQQVQPLDPEWLQQMYADGWRKIQEGVLQRDTAGGSPETFSYGSEGLQWVLRGHQQRLDSLEERFDQAPSKRLLELIEQLKGELSRLNRALEEAPSVDRFDNETMTTCTPSFGGGAQASPPAETWGVEAVANAWFYNDCGHLGDTFATAYAHAIEGTVETATTQSDPKNGGSWLDSQAVAKVNGSTGCESSAQATVTSGELGIAYQTPFVQNFKCAYNTSVYTLDTTAWAQTGPGNIGPLTVVGTGYTLIDSNYSPIATSGLPQAGIRFGVYGSLLHSEEIDTSASFASASVIKVEFVGRLAGDPIGDSPLISLGEFVSGVGTTYGLRIFITGSQILGVTVSSGVPETSSQQRAPNQLVVQDTVTEGYRWIWIENSPGSALGTSQWWRKLSGAWQVWGLAKSDMPRPIGHAKSRLRIHANQAGSSAAVPFEILHASVTVGTR